MSSPRMIENADGAWECEYCSSIWEWAHHPSEGGHIRYCPSCGREIVGFVDYEPEEGE